MYSFIASLIVSAGVVFGTAAAVNYSDNQPQNFSASTVQLDHFCSGTVIEDPTGKGRKTIITAKHCVVDLYTGKVENKTIPITVKTYDEKGRTISEDSIKFDVVRVSDKSDLALLQSDSALFNLPSIAVYRGDLHTGDNVFAVGYPSGSVLTITEGYLGPIEIVPAFSIISKDQEFRSSTTLIAPGSSGGSLIMTSVLEGPKRVGVATGMNTKYNFMTYWPPIEEIREFLANERLDEVLKQND